MTEQTATDLGQDWYWSDYWGSGQQACCFNTGTDNYAPEIVKVWIDFFGQLPDNARILDLCSGNGAIAVTAVQVGQRRGVPFEVHAIDRADLYVERTRLYQPAVHGAVKFQSGVSAEALPFPDAYFDSVVGQFGIEYTDIAKSVAEVGRVAKADARLRFVLHARDSAVLGSAQGQLAGAQFLAEMNLLGAAKAFVTRAAVVDAAGANATDEEKRAAGEVAAHMQSLLKSLDDGMKILDAPMFLLQVKTSLGDVLAKRQAVGPEAATKKLDELQRSIDGHCARLHALFKAAQDERGARAIAAMFEAQGFKSPKIEPMTLPENKRLFGWLITTQR